MRPILDSFFRTGRPSAAATLVLLHVAHTAHAGGSESPDAPPPLGLQNCAPPTPPAHFDFGVGAAFVSAPQTGNVLSPGLELTLAYHAWDFELIGSGYLGGGAVSPTELGFGGVLAGGRYFLGGAYGSAFFGAGGGFTGMFAEGTGEAGPTEHASFGRGMAGYAEVGLALRRYFSPHVVLALRAELPFYSMEELPWSEDMDMISAGPTAGVEAERVSPSYWATPVSLSCSLYF